MAVTASTRRTTSPTPTGPSAGPAVVRPPARGGALPGSPEALLAHARTVLTEAAATPEPGERFCLAHLAALRIAAAVLAERGRPAAARRRLVSAWVLIEAVAPEWAEWADYFAAAAPVRAALEAGAVSAVTARQADDQLRAAAQFLELVETAFGMLRSAPIAS